MDQLHHQQVSNERVSGSQLDELLGVARGLLADGQINQDEVEFLETWLLANRDMSDLPVVNALYLRVREMLADGVVDEEDKAELLETLRHLSGRDLSQVEALRGNSLPLCNPAPALTFLDRFYCFTGVFNYGRRSLCEGAIIERGGIAGGLSISTHVLVIGMYTTDLWRQSATGSKIATAVEFRRKGVPISIVSEAHWLAHL